MLLQNKSILRRERIEVKQEDDLVVLIIGNASLRMPYDTAFKVSAWLRIRGRQAKRFSGDTSRNMLALGALTNLEE